MARGRPQLALGTFGNISTKKAGDRWRARARFRDYDGQVRDVVRFGLSENKAITNLKVALADRTGTPATGADLTRDTRVKDLVERWITEVESNHNLAPTTRARYAVLGRTFVTPGLGGLRLSEVTVSAVDRFLIAVTANHGAATARGVRSAVSGMMQLAIRHDAMTVNPTREVSVISAPRKSPARALTWDEEGALFAALRNDEIAVQLDLVDLVEFLAGTGCRIGEACALRPGWVDLEGGVVEIAAQWAENGTIEERTKTSAGWRVIAVPAHVIALMNRRIDDPDVASNVAIFTSPMGRIRNKSNTTGDLRRAFDRAGFDWVTSHTFRKTVATRLDEAGQSPRQIADHLGHSRPSMTLDVYVGRRVASSAAARILARPE